MPTVVDDFTLLAVLIGDASAPLEEAAAAGELLTTGSWYYRLYRAVHDPTSRGVFWRRVGALPHPARQALFEDLDDLPAEIVVPGPRVVVPVMGALRLARRVNHLTAEALAVALVSGGGVRVTSESPPLQAACAELGIPLELLSPHT